MPPDFFAKMPEARARRKGGMGGIPPRPSVPPERSGGGQSGFSAKWVLTFSNKHHHETKTPLRC